MDGYIAVPQPSPRERIIQEVHGMSADWLREDHPALVAINAALDEMEAQHAALRERIVSQMLMLQVETCDSSRADYDEVHNQAIAACIAIARED